MAVALQPGESPVPSDSVGVHQVLNLVSNTLAGRFHGSIKFKQQELDNQSVFVIVENDAC
jgi:hypothetical protein